MLAAIRDGMTHGARARRKILKVSSPREKTPFKELIAVPFQIPTLKPVPQVRAEPGRLWPDNARRMLGRKGDWSG